MAIYRTVQMSFWTDSKVVDDFTPEDRYFYLYLMTNNHTNLCGCYEVSIKQMAYDMGYNNETIDKLINRMESEHNVIRYNRATKEIYLLNWSKYNWQGGKQKKPLLNQIKEIKCKEFREELLGIFEAMFQYPIEGVSEKEVYPIEATVTVPVTVPVTDTVTDSDTVQEDKVKHRYGEYHNVLLTDKEYDNLLNIYPDLSTRIERLSEYIASSGKKYKSHYATIRSWARREEKDRKPKAETELENYYKQTARWAEELEDD